MTSECSEIQQRIPRSFVGELTADEQQALNEHVAACPSCQKEHERYAETLRLLQSVEDEPVPRHFFVYPEERREKPWHLFRQMMPLWQAVTAGVVGMVVLLGVAAASGLQVRSDHGVWTMGFGIHDAQANMDLAAFKADILQTAQERFRNEELARIQALRSDITRSRDALTQQQQTQLVAALTTLESRLTDRIALTADDIKSGTQRSILDLYHNVSLQRGQDIATLNARLDKAEENSDARTRQTDAALETLFQVAELRIRQNGDQK